VISRRWIPTVLWAVVILVLTSVPTPAGPGGGLGLDKAVHLVLYAILGWLAIRAASRGSFRARTAAVTLAAIALFAVVDELHQVFIPWRTGDISDWVADLTGGAIGIAFAAATAARRISPS
jgi:VanZ family protein